MKSANKGERQGDTYGDDDVLADRVDGKGDTGDGEHGRNDTVRRRGGCPGVGGGKVHGHLVDLDSLDQTDADLCMRGMGNRRGG